MIGAATSTDYQQMLIALLPPGAVWRAMTAQGRPLRAAIDAIADLLAAEHARILEFIAELHPDTATETIGAWETLVMQPNAAYPQSSDLAIRRGQVTAAMTAGGCATHARLVALAATLGVTATVEAPWYTVGCGQIRAGMPLLPHCAHQALRIGAPTAPVALKSRLEAMLDQVCPAHLLLLYDYTGSDWSYGCEGYLP